ncbi:phage tail sheath subtilisin-like domain-containing protein [Ahrensia sp. R2A130]|uniref:phage tail sheath subtilisin-like domain-containing protein n=1 Tax=Ahrensia sp. R2A130 TaxID=744979 RepID=UPI0001E0B513|nr:phage tail sheath subtilisin-like domain-containing protein [Ahrensia sp. R2A130]EFL88289.1 putative bacteriophage Mu tail sheath [Ahrensia sp. R2A130]
MIGFENIPGSGLVAPLISFEVTSGGQFESNARHLIIGHANAGAAIATNEPIVVTSREEIRNMAGVGSMLDRMGSTAFRNAPVQETWIMAVPATGTAGEWTLTVANPQPGQGFMLVGGIPVSVDIVSGDTAADVAANLAVAINAAYNDITGETPEVTAAANAAVVTCTARHAGQIFIDYDFYIPELVARYTKNAFTGVITKANSVTPTGVPDLSTGLAALGDEPFDFVTSPFSDTANLARYDATFGDVSGRFSYARQSYGHVLTVATDTISALTTTGLGRNSRHETIVPRFSAAGNAEPAWAWAAAAMSSVITQASDGVTAGAAANQTGIVMQGITAPRSRALHPAYPTRNTLNRSGISTWSVTGDGKVAIDKLITTYQRDPLGQVDTTFRDIQWYYPTIYFLRLARQMFAIEHGRHVIADANPGGLLKVSTTRTIAGTLVRAYEKCGLQGLMENPELFAKRLVVRRNADNPNRVDVFAPLDRSNPLDVIASNARLYSQINEANVAAA